jgi:hypothetical protein
MDFSFVSTEVCNFVWDLSSADEYDPLFSMDGRVVESTIPDASFFIFHQWIRSVPSLASASPIPPRERKTHPAYESGYPDSRSLSENEFADVCNDHFVTFIPKRKHAVADDSSIHVLPYPSSGIPRVPSSLVDWAITAICASRFMKPVRGFKSNQP